MHKGKHKVKYLPVGVETSAPVHSESREVIKGKVRLDEGSRGCRQVVLGQISG